MGYAHARVLASRVLAKPSQSARRRDTGAPTSSLKRLLGLLDLFTPFAPTWSTDDLIQAQGMTRSTGYRYIKALSDARLLSAVANGCYILGPRIIELDRQIRQCDPLYTAAGPALKQLVAHTRHSAIVCALFSGSVLCVREELTPDSPPSLFARGQTRPLFQGAASRVMLAHLRPHQLRRLYAKHKRGIAAAGLGSNWESFRTALGEIRRNGHVVSVGEFNPGVVGISAPIFNRAGQILGSIGIAGAESKFSPRQTDRTVERVIAAARQVSERVALVSVGTDRPARAVR